jgi:CheY-like chemotaxis protein
MRRAPVILTVLVGLILLGASAWCIRVVREVASLREQVDRRVGSLVEIRAVLGELQAARRPDEISAAARGVDELARALASRRSADDPSVVHSREAARRGAELAAIAEHSDAAAPDVRAAIARELDAVVPELHRENAELSAELGRHWSAINVVAALAVAFAVATTALLGYLVFFAMPRVRMASERLGRLATKLAATPTAFGISHGVGGPMTVAMTSLELLRERLDEGGGDEESRQLLDDALHALARATGTLQDLRGGTLHDEDPVSARADAQREPVLAAPLVAPQLHILLIDDDEMVAVSTKRVLRAHRVETVSDGARGIELALAEDFDLILCDLMMPGKNGMEVYRALCRARPELVDRFVFMTGGANDADAAAFLEQYPGARLDKPFGTKQLRELVARFAPHDSVPPPARGGQSALLRVPPGPVPASGGKS